MLAFALALLLASSAAAAPARVKISWSYEAVPGTMTVRAAHDERPLWETGVAADLAGVPAGDVYANETLELGPGETRRAVLVYRNPTSETVRFFAAPHSAAPAAASLGFKFKCLCVNHVYVVPPGAWWYRVVELRLARGFAAPALEIRHQLIAVNETRGDPP